LDETGRDVGERPMRPVEPVRRGPIDEIGQLALF
jgi:hypothetical protein